MRIYVGNLSYDTTEETLYQVFGEHGRVEEAHVVSDRDTGRPRGFAFVAMPNDEEARQAIRQLDGTQLEGRRLTVNEARPRTGGGGGGAPAGGRGRPREHRERW